MVRPTKHPSFAVMSMVLLAVAGIATGAAPAAASSTPYTIDDGHDLDDEAALDEYDRTGQVTGQTDTLDVSLTVAESRHDIGMRPSGLSDAYNDAYLRIEYDETADRTLRIYIPREYWVPYTREQVDSMTGDHHASFEPIRGGDYTEVTIHFDGQGDAVLPVRKYATVGTGWSVDRVDEYLNETTGHKVRSDPGEWQYIRDEQLAEGPGVEITNGSADVLVQYDATPDQERETWVNAPKGSPSTHGIYWYVKQSENSTAYVISDHNDPPAVRYKHQPRYRDTWTGRFNDLEYSIKSTVGSWFGGGDSSDDGDTEDSSDDGWGWW